MTLPLEPPLTPMLAKLGEALPEGEGWRYEPKWDGFRALIFKDGERLDVISRSGQPLARYFPELVALLKDALPDRCVVDGEIILRVEGRLEFEVLLQRIHPAKSRIEKLSKETPVGIVFFDLLALGDENLVERPLSERRERLKAVVKTGPDVMLTPQTESASLAKEWFVRLEASGLDGVMAKRADGIYTPGERHFVKVKHARTCDCVIGGFRFSKAKGKTEQIGSLLLGLYDEEKRLIFVGATVSFSAALRKEVEAKVRPLEGGPSFDEAFAPGGLSRWNSGTDKSWVAVRPELVCEVAFDHLQGRRFRHATRFERWRPDKAPEACDYSQLPSPKPLRLEDADILHAP